MEHGWERLPAGVVVGCRSGRAARTGPNTTRWASTFQMPSGEAWTLLFRNTWLSTAKKNISIIGCEPLPQLVNLLLDYNMLRLACVMPSDRGKLLVEVGESISAVEADLERYRPVTRCLRCCLT